MMHPEFRQLLLHDHELAVARGAERARLRRPPEESGRRADTHEPVVLRLCCVHDDPALERLATLEGRPLPTGRFVIAEVDGLVVAALPVEGGHALADPFRTTAHLLPLLELRASQLRSGRSDHGRLGILGILGAVRGWSGAS